MVQDGQFITRFETSQGIRFRVIEGGTGEDVVLLPGWPQSVHCWRKVMPLLADRYRLLAIDPPGLGETDALPGGSDTRAVAAALRTFLAERGRRRFFLVTHDIGTWIGYAFAAQYPDMVRKLVAIDALVPGVAPPQGYAFEKARIVKNWHFFFNALPELPEMLVAGRERDYLRFIFRTRSADFSRTFDEADIDAYVRCYSRPGAMSAGYSYYRAIFETGAQNVELAKSKLAMPVLAVGGALWLGPVMAPMFAAVADDVTGAVVADCGHFVPEEAPEEAARLIRAFLGAGGA